MKARLIALATLLPLLASAEPLLVSAKVLDRAQDGSVIRGLYVYPSVLLEPGEPASLHIGPTLRYPIGSQTIDLGDGVSKEETIYTEEPAGFTFSLNYELKGGMIHYHAKGVSKVAVGTAGQASFTQSSEVIFYGQVELGGLVEAQLTGPNGHTEDITIHFGPAPEEE